MEKTSIIVLVEAIQYESQRALDNWKLMNDSKGKIKTQANESYIKAIRNIHGLSRSIEKLNEGPV